MVQTTEAALRAEIQVLQEKLAALTVVHERDVFLAAELAEKASQRAAMLSIVPVGVVLADANGRILMGNGMVERMVGHPVLNSEDVESYGEWISFHADGTRVQSHEYPLARVLTEKADYAELDVHYQRGDGTKFWMRIIGQALSDETGNRIGAAVALVDVDREYQLQNQQEILIGELNHRVKNAFSVVKSIVSMSLRKQDLPSGLRLRIDERLDTYAKAHSKLVGSDWDEAPLTQIVEDIVVAIAGERVTFSGPSLSLPSRQALSLSMAFYELSTNAVKYGSLSVPKGIVTLTWEIDCKPDGNRLSVAWVERHGPETVEPEEKGFGTFIIDRALAMETGGNVRMHFGKRGFEWHLEMPVDG